MTLTELTDRFPDESTAKAHLFNLRWPEGKVACPRCGKDEKIYRRAARKGEAVSYRWTCKSCNKNGYGFSLTTGTIFEEAKLPLHKFFQVLLLMLTSKKGMSALQVQRTVFGQRRNRKGWLVGQGSYESTWYACHRIRAAMKDEHFRRLTGVVEIDETYIGRPSPPCTRVSPKRDRYPASAARSFDWKSRSAITVTTSLSDGFLKCLYAAR